MSSVYRANEAMKTADGPPDDSILLKFVSFLISRKAVAEAGKIWHGHGGADGMTNGSFEQAVSNTGFDWRWGRDPEGHWNLQQAFGQGRERGTAARLMFYGQANLAFHHLYQIVPVAPGAPCRLRWWPRSSSQMVVARFCRNSRSSSR